MADDKKSTYVGRKGTIEFDFFDKKAQDEKVVRYWPLCIDAQIGTFGDDDDEFKGTIQAGVTGITVTLKNGNKYRILPQQFLDFISELEENKGK